ncbi:MAG: DUF3656 domain-containing protein [Chloroflexota bacterium]
MQGRSPRHRGVLLGHVTAVFKDRVRIAPEPTQRIAPLKAGDGIVFDAADWRSPEEAEEGGHVYQVDSVRGGQLELRFGNKAIDFGRIRVGDLLWRTHDPELDKAARPFTQAHDPVYKRPLHIDAVAYEGQPLQLTWTLAEQPHIQVSITSPEPLVTARNQGLTAEFARDQLGRLGNTPYELAELHLESKGRPFVPSSLLNNLRREAVTQLQLLQAEPRPRALHEPLHALQQMWADRETAVAQSTPIPQLHLLVRTPEQLEAAIAARPASITLDYLDLYGLRPAVAMVQEAGIAVRVASPRVLKPNEERIVNFLLRLECPLLIRSSGLLHALQAHDHAPLIGDFSLNTANALTADTFLRLGLLRLTPTHDLNAAQVTDLAHHVGADKLEVIAYQHLPVFHTEHCVFCRFLSTGTSYKDCGQPCEKHRVALRDGHGRTHPVMADVGCRNTVFGAEAQEASVHLESWLAAGIVHYRLEFVHETAVEVTDISQAFQQALNRQIPASILGGRLRQIAPQGTTEGSLFVPNDYLTLPVL